MRLHRHAVRAVDHHERVVRRDFIQRVKTHEHNKELYLNGFPVLFRRAHECLVMMMMKRSLRTALPFHALCKVVEAGADCLVERELRLLRGRLLALYKAVCTCLNDFA